jgi:hypothetical protein
MLQVDGLLDRWIKSLVTLVWNGFSWQIQAHVHAPDHSCRLAAAHLLCQPQLSATALQAVANKGESYKWAPGCSHVEQHTALLGCAPIGMSWTDIKCNLARNMHRFGLQDSADAVAAFLARVNSRYAGECSDLPGNPLPVIHG